MKLKALLLASALLIATSAFAADAPPAQLPIAGTVQNPKQMPEGLYTLDSSHVHTIFFISHLGFSEYAGSFNDISGNLTFRPNNLGASKLDVTIKTDSINVQSSMLTDHLKGAGFFDSTKYPTITFTNSQLVAKDSTHGALTGNLTLHGVTKPVTLDVTFLGGGIMPMKNVQTMGFLATGAIKRSDFGMTEYLPGLGDDVRLEISAEFNKADTTPPAKPLGETK